MANNKIIQKKKISKDLGFFRFKEISTGEYLLTNDVGDFIFLSKDDFSTFTKGKIDKGTNLYKELSQKKFVNDDNDFSEFIERYREKHQHLFQKGTSLHIIVATLRCNHNCIYCQASSCGLNEKNKDLDMKTARQIVDTIFSSPNQEIAIEFQGGEPLLNWPVVKFIIGYANKKNKREKRKLRIALVSNFSLMDEKIADYLFKNKVSFCTSLDGPEELHNKNRIWTGGNSHCITTKWLKYLMKKYKGYYIFQPAALTTITKHSLAYWKEIVDEYVKFGFDNITLRPLTPLGIAQKGWKSVGYSPDDFLEFYRKSLDYIFFLNLKKGKKFREITTTYFAKQILFGVNSNFFELRSPCGAGIGQLLYNYNGDIYTCDEGRMIKEDIFKIGKVGRSSYKDIISHPAVKTICLASNLESLACDNCAYKPYCGVCPVLSYAEFGNIFSQLPNSSRCRLNKGILDYLFLKIKENEDIRELLRKWVIGENKNNL